MSAANNPNMTRLIITAMVLVISSQAYAISAKDRLVNALKAVSTINGTFSQTTSGSKTLKGNFKIKRPNKFIWVYGGRDGQKIISTGKRVWIEEPDLEHAYHLSLKRALGKSPALLLLNPAKLSKEFNLFSSGKQAGLDWVELKPKSRGNAEFEKLFVGLNSKGIKQIKIIDALNRTTVINFTSLHFDRPLSDNLFKYTPPSEFDSF